MLPEGKAWYGRHGSMQHVRDKSIKRTVPPARLEEIFECEEGLRLNRTPRARSAAVTQCVDCVGVRMDQELLPITVFKRKLDADRDGLCNGVAASHCLPRARRDTAKAHTPAVENLVADVELRPGGVQVDPPERPMNGISTQTVTQRLVNRLKRNRVALFHVQINHTSEPRTRRLRRRNKLRFLDFVDGEKGVEGKVDTT